MSIAFIPGPMWLSSAESVSWESPRLVLPRSFLAGPMAERQYLWLSYQPVETGLDEPLAPQDVVVTPRFTFHFEAPRVGHPVHVHLWVAQGSEELASGRFQPQTPQGDAWCTLYSTREEAAGEPASTSEG